jgi:hypothetical protein
MHMQAGKNPMEVPRRGIDRLEHSIHEAIADINRQHSQGCFSP